MDPVSVCRFTNDDICLRESGWWQKNFIVRPADISGEENFFIAGFCFYIEVHCSASENMSGVSVMKFNFFIQPEIFFIRNFLKKFHRQINISLTIKWLHRWQ